MTIATVRRLAADIMHVGQNKVRIKPDGFKEADGALTRSDVKGLIEKGIIIKLKPQGRASTARSGRTGHGRRRGTPVGHKTAWMEKIRAQRRFFQMLVEGKVLQEGAKRALYSKIKSGIFRNKRAMLLYLKENKLVPADFEPPKPAYQKPAAKEKAPALKKEAKPAQSEKKGEQR